MDTTERQVIDELFGKLRQAETQSPSRDMAAEDYIMNQIKKQPAAPYYMSQAIVIQEQALAAAQARIRQLEEAASAKPEAGGFLSSLFGGGPSSPPTPRAAPRGAIDPRIAPYAQGRSSGGGFLAGAMQTALGVAGGVLIGNALMEMLAPDEAAAEVEAAPIEDSAEDMGDAGGFENEEF